MSNKCTYEIPRDTGEQIESRQCGGLVTTVFERDGRMYPRCKRHATDKIKEWARDHDYEITTDEAED